MFLALFSIRARPPEIKVPYCVVGKSHLFFSVHSSGGRVHILSPTSTNCYCYYSHLDLLHSFSLCQNNNNVKSKQNQTPRQFCSSVAIKLKIVYFCFNFFLNKVKYRFLVKKQTQSSKLSGYFFGSALRIATSILLLLYLDSLYYKLQRL